MSTESLSRSSISTIAELIEAVNGRADLPRRRRQDLTSGLRRFCRNQNREPAEVSAEPGSVRRALGTMSAENTGLSLGALRNLRSLVVQALLLAGVTSVPPRSRTPLSMAWRPVIEAVEDRHRRDRLIHFARYLSERGVEPADVDQVVMDDYGQNLISKSLVKRPKQAAREAALVWNAAIAASSGLGLTAVAIRDGRRRYALSVHDFPSSFGAELAAYLGQSKGEDLFGECASYPASADTIAGRRKWILGLASALVESGCDRASIRSIANLVEPEAAKAALNVVWNRLDRRKTGYLQNLAQLLVNLGRHWVKLPPEQLEILRTYRTAIKIPKTGMTEGNRRKLLQFADPANVRQLYQLPERLMEDALRRDRGGIQEAVQAQTAVAIAIELKAPLRIRTLVSLDLEKHVVRSKPGAGAIVHLVVPSGLVKNREPLTLELPASVVRLLDIYANKFRSRLVSRPGSWLFPGQNGPKDRGGMSKQISEAVRKWTGLTIHTHLFRHLAGFLILRESPGELETVRLLLGDRSIETIVRSYSGMEQDAAFRRYDQIVSRTLAGEVDRDAAD